MGYSLSDFIRESNRIEGILREPTPEEVHATTRFLSLPQITVSDMTAFVGVCAPGHRLRTTPNLNVRVGSHIAPRGGPEIGEALKAILADSRNPYFQHHAYETLHPFTDGNGRSGRALWLWSMGGLHRAPLGFLHHWYYQSLEFSCIIAPSGEGQ